MLNPRENLLRVIRHEQPEYMPRTRDSIVWPFVFEVGSDPVASYDWFGVHWTWQDQPGPCVTIGKPYLEDLENWNHRIHFPILEDYEDAFKADGERFRKRWDRENQVGFLQMPNFHFERLLTLLGFENASLAFYETPDELEEFFTTLTDFKIELFRMVKKYYDPDGVITHDDWGGSKNMFFSPEMWREFIKPQIKRMVDEVHALGMIYEQHSCGHVQPIVGDLVELGVDVFQPIQKGINDLALIKSQYGSRLTLRGGMDMQGILSPVATPESIVANVRETLEICAPGGGFIPSCAALDNMAPLGKEIEKMILDEFEKYSNKDIKS